MLIFMIYRLCEINELTINSLKYIFVFNKKTSCLQCR